MSGNQKGKIIQLFPEEEREVVYDPEEPPDNKEARPPTIKDEEIKKKIIKIKEMKIRF